MFPQTGEFPTLVSFHAGFGSESEVSRVEAPRPRQLFHTISPAYSFAYTRLPEARRHRFLRFARNREPFCEQFTGVDLPVLDHANPAGRVWGSSPGGLHLAKKPAQAGLKVFVGGVLGQIEKWEKDWRLASALNKLRIGGDIAPFPQ